MRSPAVFFIGRLIPSLLGVLTTAILTRLMAPADYGRYALGLSIVFLLTTGAFEWLGLSLLRMASTVGSPERFFGTVVAWFWGIAGASVLIAAAVLLLGSMSGLTDFVAACLFAAFASAWIELRQRLQMAELRRAAYFRASVARGIMTTIFVTAAAVLDGRAPVILAAVGFSAVASGLLVREPRLSLARLRFDGAVTRTLLRFGLPLSISVGLATVLMSVDKWLLQALSGAHAVGLFSAAALIAQVPVMTLGSCIGPSVYSVAVEAVEFQSADAARAQLAQNILVLLGLVLPAAAGIVAVSEDLAHVIVGQAYWDAAILLAPWFAAASLVWAIRAFYVDTAFQLSHRTAPLMWINLLALGLNFAFDIALIPEWAELGAAIGSFAALTISFAVAWTLSRRVYRLPLPGVGIAKIAASSLVMLLVLRQFSESTGVFALILKIGLGVVIYGSGIVVLNVLDARAKLIALLRRGRDGFALPARALVKVDATRVPPVASHEVAEP